MTIEPGGGPCLPRRRSLIAAGGCLLAGALHAAPAAAASPALFVLGTHQPTTTFQGTWIRRIYVEAFRRIGIPLQIAVYPLQRLSVVVDHGLIDGDVARVAAYGAAHPEQLRVDEPLYDMGWGIYTTNPSIDAQRLEDLGRHGRRTVYLRGVAICENTLRPVLPGEHQLSAVTEETHGLQMLLARRADFYCGSDYGMLDMLQTARFKGANVRRLIPLSNATPLHTYVHRRRAEVVPLLAAALRQMKDEGLIERYRLESLKELNGR